MNLEHEFFDPLIPHQKDWFSPKEIGAIIGKSDQYVRDCLENQKIFGHVLNGKATRGQEKRYSYQIHRRGLLLFLLETANHEPSDFVRRLQILLKLCPYRQRLAIFEYLKTLLSA